MDPIIATLFSWQFVIFSMALAAVVFVIRTVVEYLMENYTSLNKNAKLWRELILPIFPVLLGAFTGYFFTTFPYPDGLTNAPDRMVFGLVGGLLSTLLYRVFNALLVQKIQQYVPVANPPACPPPVIPSPSVIDTTGNNIQNNLVKPVIGSSDAPVL